jgi:N-acetylglucosamine-6-sulfatase
VRRHVIAAALRHPHPRNVPQLDTLRARSGAATLLAFMVAMIPCAPAFAAADGSGPAPAQSLPRGDAASGPPNVVVIMVDDLPPLDRRIYEMLPAIRETFFKHGVQFSDFHSETPLCCPARVGFLTGQNTFHHGVDINRAKLFHPQMSLATQLQSVGYQTMLAGKYLNGYGELAPTVPPGWDRFSAKEGGDYYDYTYWIDGNPTAEVHGHLGRDYLTDVTRTKAVEQLRAANPKRPVFAWIGVNAPHSPWTPAPRNAKDPRCDAIAPWKPANYAEADVSDKPAWVQSQPRYRPSELRARSGFDLRPVCRTMLAVDDVVRKIRSVLQEQGRLNNTILVFAGDNGMNFGAHRLGSKLGPYETAIPFFISWPARFGVKPRLVTETVMNIDFAPTICELAGCTLGPFPNGQAKPDGRSFVPLLLGGATSMKRDSVVEDLPVTQQGVPPWYAARTTGASSLKNAGCTQPGPNACRWHYVRYSDGFEELYDISGGPCIAWRKGLPGDPCELVNLAGDSSYLPILNSMRYRLNTLRGAQPGEPPT